MVQNYIKTPELDLYLYVYQENIGTLMRIYAQNNILFSRFFVTLHTYKL